MTAWSTELSWAAVLFEFTRFLFIYILFTNLYFAKLKIFLNLELFSRRFSIIVECWFYKFILYEEDWIYFYLMVSQYWHVIVAVYIWNHLCMIRSGDPYEGKIFFNAINLLLKNQGEAIFFLGVLDIYKFNL